MRTLGEDEMALEVRIAHGGVMLVTMLMGTTVAEALPLEGSG